MPRKTKPARADGGDFLDDAARKDAEKHVVEREARRLPQLDLLKTSWDDLGYPSPYRRDEERRPFAERIAQLATLISSLPHGFLFNLAADSIAEKRALDILTRAIENPDPAAIDAALARAFKVGQDYKRLVLSALITGMRDQAFAAIDTYRRCGQWQSPLPVSAPSSAPASPPSSSPIPLLAFLPGALIYRGIQKDLSGYPLKIIMALYAATGKTMTMQEIQDRVWNDVATEQGTVRTHISAARKPLLGAMKQSGVIGILDPIKCVDTKPTAFRLILDPSEI